jgi:DNA-binding NarL/FixJ family response regulator
MKGHRVRILLADDHDVVRTGVAAILKAREGWHVCGEAANGIEAVRLAAEMRPHIVVLDLQMGELDGLTVMRRIKKRDPQIELVIFTMHDDESLIREVLSAGARAFVLKSEGVRALEKAIECAIEHEPFFSPRATETLLSSFHMSPTNANGPSPLTDRERQIVPLLASGKSNKEVAGVLGISVKTVETHRAAIMRKLGFTSITKLVRYAIRQRFIKA